MTDMVVDAVRQAQGGREGGIGWLVRSPRQAELILDYDVRGICGLRIRQADETAVVDAFEKAVKGYSAGAALTAESPRDREVDGVRTTYRAYSFPYRGGNAHVALTTAEKEVGGQQHFMTFGFVQ